MKREPFIKIMTKNKIDANHPGVIAGRPLEREHYVIDVKEVGS